MSVTVTMDGFDKVAAQLDHFPKEVEKAIKKTMRKSAKPYLAAVKGSMPFPEWNSELTIKTKVNSKQGRIMLSSGVFGTTHLDNGAIPAFFKFLWRNYVLCARCQNWVIEYESNNTDIPGMAGRALSGKLPGMRLEHPAQGSLHLSRAALRRV